MTTARRIGGPTASGNVLLACALALFLATPALAQDQIKINPNGLVIAFY